MYSLLNVALSAWFLSTVHTNEPNIVIASQNWVTLVTQQLVFPEDKRILALRADADDFILQPLVPDTQIAAALVTDPVQTTFEDIVTEVIDTGPSITVLASPKPAAPKPVVVPSTPKPKVTQPPAPVAPVVQAPVAVATVPVVPAYFPPAPVYTPPPAPVQTPVPIPTPAPPIATSAPQLVPTTRVSGPTLVAVDSTNVSGYAITIPKLGLTSVPVIPSDARTDAGIRNLQGVAQVLYPAGTANHKTVIFGHSSNYSYVRSAYNEVFRYLDRLDPGDMVYVDINGQRLNYKVTKEEIVGAETPSIVTDYGREELVLFTCWPYKSSAKRYVTYLERQF